MTLVTGSCLGVVRRALKKSTCRDPRRDLRDHRRAAFQFGYAFGVFQCKVILRLSSSRFSESAEGNLRYERDSTGNVFQLLKATDQALRIWQTFSERRSLRPYHQIASCEWNVTPGTGARNQAKDQRYREN
jgi:hypothetical protein